MTSVVRRVFTMFLSVQSKAGILAKACDYIGELQRENETLTDAVHTQVRQQQELLMLREQNNQLKNENALLRQEIN